MVLPCIMGDVRCLKKFIFFPDQYGVPTVFPTVTALTSHRYFFNYTCADAGGYTDATVQFQLFEMSDSNNAVFTGSVVNGGIVTLPVRSYTTYNLYSTIVNARGAGPRRTNVLSTSYVTPVSCSASNVAQVGANGTIEDPAPFHFSAKYTTGKSCLWVVPQPNSNQYIWLSLKSLFIRSVDSFILEETRGGLIIPLVKNTYALSNKQYYILGGGARASFSVASGPNTVNYGISIDYKICKYSVVYQLFS